MRYQDNLFVQQFLFIVLNVTIGVEANNFISDLEGFVRSSSGFKAKDNIFEAFVTGAFEDLERGVAAECTNFKILDFVFHTPARPLLTIYLKSILRPLDRAK